MPASYGRDVPLGQRVPSPLPARPVAVPSGPVTKSRAKPAVGNLSICSEPHERRQLAVPRTHG
jgi:hypothetical protein